MTLTFDANRRLQSQEVTGGDFVSADDYATQKAELEALDQEWKALVAADLATLNRTAQPAIVIR